MPDAPDVHSVVEAAEQAAAAGDYTAAESLLRQALLLQEAELGADHPGLANTLNNLGILCENTGKTADAESCYRRAYAIAMSALAPDDPLVVTSGRNLLEFCAAQGKTFELPEPVRPAPPSKVVPIARAKAARPELLRASTWVEPARPSRVSPAAIIVTIVLVGGVVWLVIAGAPFGSSTTPERLPSAPSESATPAADATATPAAEATTPAPAPAKALVETKPVETTTGEVPAVVEARACRTLSTSTWQCTPVTSPADPGVFFFYTRLRSPRDTTVQHRWYFDNALRRTVRLRVGANPGAGYRTYSRNTIVAERAGEWRVELRTDGGELIREERFVVRAP